MLSITYIPILCYYSYIISHFIQIKMKDHSLSNFIDFKKSAEELVKNSIKVILEKRIFNYTRNTIDCATESLEDLTVFIILVTKKGFK